MKVPRWEGSATEKWKADQSEEREWAEDKVCHGVWQGPALSRHFEEFALRADGSYGRVFKAGDGVTRLGSCVVSGWDSSKADLKVVRRPWQWPGTEVMLVTKTSRATGGIM